MTVRDVLQTVIKLRGTTAIKAAAAVGWTPQKFNRKKNEDTIRFSELCEILEAQDVEISFIDKKTGEAILIPTDDKIGEPIRKIVDGVRYNTETSAILASNFYQDGVNKYTDGVARELYIDNHKRYFFAEYCEWDSRNNSILPVPESEAKKFINKYGKKKAAKIEERK